MKIAILTITEGTNYGNRLQNYAVQKILEYLGIKVETLINKSGSERKRLDILLNIKRIIGRIKNYLINAKYKKTINIRKENFIKFNNQFINYSNIVINNEYNDSTINNIYNFFVCGSDQIWNPMFKENASANFLQFANPEKRIAFCPSFGVSTIPKNRKEEYSEYLRDFSKLSIREADGANIIKELSNRQAMVLIDPTLLLSKKDWKKISKKPRFNIEKKYILTYFLGKISEEKKENIKKIAEKKNYEIINLGKKEYIQYYTAGPSEFLWYIENAEIILTDSFHACVFSILFDKTFYVFDREDKMQSMNSRIETLFNIFNLQQQRFSNWNNIKFEHNYDHIGSILEKEREKSINFLKKALDIKEQ